MKLGEITMAVSIDTAEVQGWVHSLRLGKLGEKVGDIYSLYNSAIPFPP